MDGKGKGNSANRTRLLLEGKEEEVPVKGENSIERLWGVKGVGWGTPGLKKKNGLAFQKKRSQGGVARVGLTDA